MIGFDLENHTVTEGKVVNITVELNGELGRAVEVTVNTIAGTAKGKCDFLKILCTVCCINFVHKHLC